MWFAYTVVFLIGSDRGRGMAGDVVMGANLGATLVCSFFGCGANFGACDTGVVAVEDCGVVVVATDGELVVAGIFWSGNFRFGSCFGCCFGTTLFFAARRPKMPHISNGVKEANWTRKTDFCDFG